jgi:hypothetical protein
MGMEIRCQKQQTLCCKVLFKRASYAAENRMIANHIHDALAQVRRLQRLILEKRQFKGYSGTARFVSGTVTLLGSLLMGSPAYPQTEAAHLAGWLVILGVAVALNYGALILWYVQLPNDERKTDRALPVFDAFPALLTGAILSASLLLRGYPDLLFGIWMCLYGLAHTSCRRDLPREHWFLGIYYILCGTFFMLWQSSSFMNPWPMGLVFFIGESTGGIIFHRHKYADMESAHENG